MPSTRQIRDSENQTAAPHIADTRALARAFATFTEAAGSLEKSYALLQTEVARLRVDLEEANAKLSRSLEETARARSFLTQVLDALPCGVVVSRSDRRIRLANPEARKWLGLESSPAESSEPPALADWFPKEIPGSAHIEQPWQSAPAAEPRTLGIGAASLDAGASEERETIWILSDVTDQKQAAAEREQNERTRALAEIATVLAHEIRNPLGSMELFASLIAEATRQMPEAHQWAVHMQTGVRSLAATVNNVLQFHGKPNSDFFLLRIDRLLEHTAEFLGPLARTQGHRIEFENALGAVSVLADSQRLRQVFLNIALNGFRAMPEGGTLAIRLQRAFEAGPSILQIEFQDEGCGMEAATIDKIFEPGFTTRKGSPGLGLSVSKRVIEQHRGSIQVESRQGQGSIFTIYLPVSEEAQ